MVLRSFWRLFAALAALLALATPALAGGWALVTLDTLPSEIRAGQTTSLGFMVRQHGVTPIDTSVFGGTAMMPLLSARNTVTGETIQVTARKQGPLGHFVVDVTFPQAGSWDIEITPLPFAGTKLGAFTVLAATAKSTADAQSQPAALAALAGPSSRIWSITALVLAIALGLTALVERQFLSRLLSGRNRHAAEAQPAHSRTS